MKVGFTGSQDGCSFRQHKLLFLSLRKLKDKGFHTFHHGACIGADEEAHDIARKLGYRIVVHPCTITSKQVQRCIEEADEVRAVKPPLDRNQDIVDEVDILFATPKKKEEQLRSGTWATVRRARKAGRQHRVIDP